MTYQLITTKQFEKAYKKFAGRNAMLKSGIAKALKKIVLDPYDSSLRTHKLSGNLAAYLACYCGYDCRIIFVVESSIDNPDINNILLLDIGTHDDVY
ncbi:type II toxin-antitoxin system mRNA interferase toxin, RelE/StbE family [Sphingobacterium olei]|uniref:Type II toxin-antitoxin system mRNA interferase toxin, RelE/StbE family n=1 Tax=Sphingobacterium olei TaxID=2571155 RepID=A0A4V5MKA6_9SPHI|nr:type II toxin-antitoxin system YafQ family toxin [Sphingobacterium olei]TJZ52498.1 type II toxin-antitoxin system mRNA interferase toxin, RelE/StbE family [Sphingobacterium olei]